MDISDDEKSEKNSQLNIQEKIDLSPQCWDVEQNRIADIGQEVSFITTIY